MLDPKEILKKAQETQAGQAVQKTHAAADGIYQKLTRPDRPLEPDPTKKPWLAALFSLLAVGAGQLYNRQLVKAILLFLAFYVLGTVLAVVYSLLGWVLEWEGLAGWLRIVAVRLRELDNAFLIIWAGLWVFAMVDAWRTASALRSGRLFVRYGFLRQGGFALASFIPFLGMLIPSETASADDAQPSLRDVATDKVRDHVRKRFVVPLLRYSCLAVGLLLLVVGMTVDVHILYTLGALVVVAGIFIG